MDEIELKETRPIPVDDILALYRANEWSCLSKPKELYDGVMNSHSLVTAWDGEDLIGLGNAISDGSLVVYFPHLLVLPDYQRRGIGTRIMEKLLSKYKGFHQQILLAEGTVDFYRKCGFRMASGCDVGMKIEGCCLKRRKGSTGI